MKFSKLFKRKTITTTNVEVENVLVDCDPEVKKCINWWSRTKVVEVNEEKTDLKGTFNLNLYNKIIETRRNNKNAINI